MTRFAFSDLDPEDLNLVEYRSLGYVDDSFEISSETSVSCAIIGIAGLNLKKRSAAHILRSGERLRLAAREVISPFAGTHSVLPLISLMSAWALDAKLGLLYALTAYVSVSTDTYAFGEFGGQWRGRLTGSRYAYGPVDSRALQYALKEAQACEFSQLNLGRQDGGMSVEIFLSSLEYGTVLDELMDLADSEIPAVATDLLEKASNVQQFCQALHESVKCFVFERQSNISRFI